MASYSDDFNRASLGANWTSVNSGTWDIVSSVRARQTNTANAYRVLRYASVMDGDDVDVSIGARGGTYCGAGVLVRAPESGTSSTSVDGYAIMLFGGDQFYLIRLTDAGDTVLDTYASTPTANTEYTLRITVEGSTITGYVNGTERLNATDTTYTGGSGNRAVALIAYYATAEFDTFSADDIGGGTTYNQSAAGSMAPSGANVRRTNKALAGALSLAGALVRAAGKSLAGVLAPAGATVRSTAKTAAGALGLAGALAAVRTVLASVGGALSLAGALARQTAKPVAGALTPAGAVARSTAKALAGAMGLAGALAADLVAGVIEQAVGGVLGLAGALSRQTNITTAGALAFSGAVARSIAKSLAGALGLAGALVRALFGPSASKLDVTIGDAAQTTLTIGDAAQTALTIANAAQTTLTIGDAAV